MRRLALFAVLAAGPWLGASAESEQAQAAARLAARAQDALDGILGPGRSRVAIDVAGEHSESNTDANFLFPMARPAPPKPAVRKVDLPGFAGVPGYAFELVPEPPKPEPAAAAPMQEEHEASRHDRGFQIQSVHASVILDSTLDDALVREASQVLPQVLGLDMTRGDTLGIMRAHLRPAWKLAFATPGDWRAAAYALGGGIFALLAAVIVFAGLIGAGRALGVSLGRELSAGRPHRAEPSAAEALPELSPGAAGFIEASASVPGGGAPLLGRRFDFLMGRDVELVTRALEAEQAEDLSFFFGHLAESIPDLASRLFTRLPSDVQAEVSRFMLKLSAADPERLSAIEERLRRAVENGVVGPHSLGRILSRVPGETRGDLIGRLSARDVDLRSVERHVFAFEDLERLDQDQLRRLLGAAPFELWGAALRGAPKALRDAVLTEMPEAPREQVRAAASSPQSRERIVQARSRIMDALAGLEARGDVSLGGVRQGGDLL